MRTVGKVTAYYTKADFPSHHFLCKFTVKAIEFSSMEQMLMYSKAMHFGDKVNAKRIMSTDLCQAQKMIGRDVTPFDREDWLVKAPQIAYIGNIAKYRHNPRILRGLLDTGDTLLVEATKRDTLWGCGIDEDDPRIGDPTQWTGQNLHGQVQMRVRQYFVENPQMVPEDDFTPSLLEPENTDPFSRRRN